MSLFCLIPKGVIMLTNIFNGDNIKKKKNYEVI